MNSFTTSSGAKEHTLYEPVTNFTNAIQKFILILGIVGLFIAGVVYTQRKRAEGRL